MLLLANQQGHLPESYYFGRNGHQPNANLTLCDGCDVNECTIVSLSRMYITVHVRQQGCAGVRSSQWSSAPSIKKVVAETVFRPAAGPDLIAASTTGKGRKYARYDSTFSREPSVYVSPDTAASIAVSTNLCTRAPGCYQELYPQLKCGNSMQV